MWIWPQETWAPGQRANELTLSVLCLSDRLVRPVPFYASSAQMGSRTVPRTGWYKPLTPNYPSPLECSSVLDRFSECNPGWLWTYSSLVLVSGDLEWQVFTNSVARTFCAKWVRPGSSCFNSGKGFGTLNVKCKLWGLTIGANRIWCLDASWLYPWGQPHPPGFVQLRSKTKLTANVELSNCRFHLPGVHSLCLLANTLSQKDTFPGHFSFFL